MARRNFPVFRREDYEAVRRLLPDLRLPEAFEEWEQTLNEEIAKMEARRDTIVKVIFDPQKFVIWCQRSGLDHNFASFGAFITAMSREQSKDRT